ncbi:Arc family DNA-binding protein [Citrobacter portucalensis]|uniref:Arc family DNA-binding protein n=1 Tax=Citrobacter portucalensis TaxID=1639133 RepID=A0A5B0STM0_9ENTR|nr:Arc family DNA-binding protein [Citrobacter portucalensis]KAA1140403.1 Arc family DNA-binding protein [Citrobacter portucalensis]
MSREDPQLRVRLPQELKNNIKESAKLNRRSINAEIVTRLSHTFQTDNKNSIDNELAIQRNISNITESLLQAELPEYVATLSKLIMTDAYIEKICLIAREQAEKDWKERLK